MKKRKCIRKSLAVGTLVLILGVSIIPSSGGIAIEKPSSSNDRFSSPGNILHVGGDGPSNYSSIQTAIDDATDGDTVFVYSYSSPYYENLVVDKSINLVGENKATTVIDGSSSGDVVFISADSVAITSFTIQNSGKNVMEPDSGVHIFSNFNSISENVIKNNLEGIFLKASSNNIISNNIISNNSEDGIFIFDWTYNHTISSNIISNNKGEGIRSIGDFENHHHNILGNTIEDNVGGGIYLVGSSCNLISGNVIKRNHLEGIWVAGWLSNTIITKNTISYNSWGIDVGSTVNNTFIFRNVITVNYYGIWIDRASYTNITGNNITYNVKIGLCLKGGSNNSICLNNFANNRPHMFFCYDVSSNHNNILNQNYWDRPRLLPKPIFGIRELYIEIKWFYKWIPLPWIVFDLHPAREPYIVGDME
ncbi:MAG: right-handed parallel beta-helix repeat-containing protein [Thermoplasmatales archaeon]|nr:MAG: right-handed parallel beta-helix repeat-containing protein [Thermoplasmatales archaeon]